MARRVEQEKPILLCVFKAQLMVMAVMVLFLPMAAGQFDPVGVITPPPQIGDKPIVANGIVYYLKTVPDHCMNPYVTRYPTGGVVQGRRALMKSDNPHRIYGNIEIPPDACLYIEPGTIMRFGPGFGIIVNGTLIARGSEEPGGRIVMTKDAGLDTGAPSGDWRTDARLSNGNTTQDGQLQLLYLGKWRSMCTNYQNFTLSDVNVTCRHLGFLKGNFTYNSFARNLTSHMLWEQPSCNGSENSLFDCPGAKAIKVGAHICDGQQVVGIECEGLRPGLAMDHWRGIEFFNASNYLRLFDDNVYMADTYSWLEYLDILYPGLDTFHGRTQEPNIFYPKAAISASPNVPLMNNVTIMYGAYDGFNLTDITGFVHIANCTIHKNRGHGIFIKSAVGQTLVNMTQVTDNWGDGIKFYISNLTIHDFQKNFTWERGFCNTPSSGSQVYPVFEHQDIIGPNGENKYNTYCSRTYTTTKQKSVNLHFMILERDPEATGKITVFVDGQSQTIRTKDPAKEESVGKVYLKELSFSDVKVASVMYGCSAPCLNPVTCGDGGFLDQNCQCVCPDGSKDCEVSKDNKEVSTDTSGVTDESCINRYDNWKCSIWANYGECERNPLYMETYCTKSCAMCGKSKEKEDKNHFTTWAWQWFGMFANLFPKDWMIGVCKDVYSYEKCSKWKELGDCVTNSKWMGKNCRMTCNQCGNPALKPETSCRNRHSDNTKCDQWALDGECILNSKWMLENCKKSCHACADGTDTHGKDEDKTKEKEEEDDSRCEDKHNTKDCQGWAKVGECSSNPSWMIPNCKKSCAKCDDGICKNLYDDTQCKIWAEDLECMANRIWMHKYCAVSCGVCTSNTTNTGTGSGTGTTTRHPEVTKRPSVTTTKRPGRERCSNLHNDVECDMWAKTGHCDINPSWMYGNCRKACRVCDGTTGNEDTGTTEVCRDREASRCPGWAKYGFCDSNPGYNLIYCKKSCNNCNGCRDEQFLCGVWSKAGHCTTNAGYMLRYCQRSCKTCE